MAVERATVAFRWIELALAFLLLAGAGLRLRGTWERRAESGESAAGATAQFTVGAAAIHDLSGVDGTGAPVGIPQARPSDTFAIFVVRAAQASADCAYWNTVVAQLKRAGPGVHAIGFCEGPGCSRVAPSSHAFPLISYAEQVVMNQVSALSHSGSALLVDAHGRAITVFRWRGLAPPETARRLLGTAHGS